MVPATKQLTGDPSRPADDLVPGAAPALRGRIRTIGGLLALVAVPALVAALPLGDSVRASCTSARWRSCG